MEQGRGNELDSGDGVICICPKSGALAGVWMRVTCQRGKPIAVNHRLQENLRHSPDAWAAWGQIQHPGAKKDKGAYSRGRRHLSIGSPPRDGHRGSGERIRREARCATAIMIGRRGTMPGRRSRPDGDDAPAQG